MARKKHRREDQNHLTKSRQLEAVTKFLRETRGLATEWAREYSTFYNEDKELDETQIWDLVKLKSLYYSGMVEALEVIELYLYDSKTIKAFEDMQRTLHGERDSFRDCLTDVQKVNNLTSSENEWLIKKLITSPLTKAVREKRDEFKKIAWDQLR